MKWLLFYLFTTIAFTRIPAQNTLGVVHYDSENVGGYTFFSPFSGTKAYLVDECGRLINIWDRGTRPGLSAYLLDNGLMLRTYKEAPIGPFTSASNAGGLELVNWNNETVWHYEINTPTRLSHHDAIDLPNGNILVLTWELVFREELIELGRDPSQIAVEGYMWSENIWEVRPTGTNGADIIWEWKIKYHYIQDFDSTKLNFGIVTDHPELFDINLPKLNSPNSNSTRDWNHFNSIDYHPELDQILISTRNSDEVWVIDHSTTSDEAAGHSGGRAGRGGDLLYRWGNANAYDRGEPSNQKLFGQHGAQWLNNPSHEKQAIIIFNNGNGRPDENHSTVEMITPSITSNGFYPLPSQVFEPLEADVLYGDRSDEFFYAPFLSNAQLLADGHVLVNAGTTGRIFEINKQRDIVWEYIVPLAGDFAIDQGGTTTNNWTFRAYRYPSDFSGLEGVPLEPGLPIEGNADLEFCLTSSTEIKPPRAYSITSDQRTIRISKDDSDQWQISLFNLSGQLVEHTEFYSELTIAVPIPGIYFLYLCSRDGKIQGKLKYVSIF